MSALAAIILLGLILGVRHAADADHVIAISTIVTRARNPAQAALVGMFWGLGHTLTIFAVGALIILFNVVIPPRAGLSMELSVGVMLIVLGLSNLAGITEWATGVLTASHADGAEVSECLGDAPRSRQSGSGLRGLGLYHSLRPVAVGIIHGLAGSAAIALLVLATIHDPMWSIAYLLVFAAGTTVGMIAITLAIALPLARAEGRFARLSDLLATSSGLLSVGFGLFIVYHVGLIDGLFTARPIWVPR